MPVFFRALSQGVVRFRWLVVVLWLVVVVLTSHFFPSLGSEINNENSQFLPASSPSNVAANLAIPLLGNTNDQSQVLVVAARPGSPLNAGDEAAIAEVVDAVHALPDVLKASYLGRSRNGEAAQIFVNAAINQSDISGLKDLASGIEHTFTTVHSPGLELHVAGPVADNVANQAKSDKTGNTVQKLSLLFIIVLLLLIFRAVLAPVITLLPAAISLAVSMRLIGELGAHGLQISEITQLLLIVLLLGAGTDYGLFLVFRVREELGAGRSPHDAVAYALERVGESISASAGTVIFALLSLLLASFGIYRDLGIPLAIGIAVILLAGLTLLPALLAIFGRAAFWPSKVRAGEEKEGWWGLVAVRLLRRPALTLVIGVAAFGAFALSTISYHSGGFGGAVTAPSGSDAASGDSLLAKYFPQASANPTNLILSYPTSVFTDPTVLERAGSALADSGLFTQIAGPLDPTGVALSPEQFAQLHAELGPAADLPAVPPASLAGRVDPALYNAYRASSLFASDDGHTVQFEVALAAGDPQSTAALEQVPQIRDALSRVAAETGASHSGVAGVAAALYDVESTSNRDLLHIIPIAIIAIGILLALVLRSLVAPFYLIVSVALSYLAALGVSVIVFIDIGGQQGLTFILPFLMFIFLLALGEDYNILVMTRIREEAARLSLRDAVTRAVARSGPTITSAGLVLAGTFAVLAVAGRGGPGGSQIEAIGVGLAVGVLLDTFVVRTLLVPAIVVLLGRWNWWPSKLGRTHAKAPEKELTAVS